MPRDYTQHHPHLTHDQNVCLVGCSKEPYYRTMRGHFEAGTCPLCQIDTTENTVIFFHERWLGWKVGGKFKSRDEAVTQLLFFPRNHLEWKDLTREHYADGKDIADWVEEKYHPVGGGCAWRFGKPEYNVGTVPNHVHITYYLINELGRFVLVPFSKTEEMIDKNIADMLTYRDNYGNLP